MVGILIIIAGIFVFQETTQEVDIQIGGILYTMDTTVKEEIVIQIYGEETHSFFESSRFRGEILISGEEVYYVRDLGLMEQRNGYYAAAYPEETTEIGNVSMQVTLGEEFEKAIGSLTLTGSDVENDEIQYYFGGPGESIDQVTDIEISP